MVEWWVSRGKVERRYKGVSLERLEERLRRNRVGKIVKDLCKMKREKRLDFRMTRDRKIM